jgi:transposase
MHQVQRSADGEAFRKKGDCSAGAEVGMTVSVVARQHRVAASQLFLWCKQYREGSLTAVAAGEQVVPASELASAMKQIKEL